MFFFVSVNQKQVYVLFRPNTKTLQGGRVLLLHITLHYNSGCSSILVNVHEQDGLRLTLMKSVVMTANSVCDPGIHKGLRMELLPSSDG